MNDSGHGLVMIAAGGTAGHLYPGLSLGKELLKRRASVHYIVRKGDNVIPFLNTYHINYSAIDVRGWDRSFSFRLIMVLFLFIKSLFQMIFIMRKFRPAVVVGMGGYVALPVVLMARLFHKPVLIHEQNSYPGLTNRLVSSFVQKIAVSFEESKSYFNAAKVVVTGNPLRIDFKLMAREAARKKLGIHRDAFVLFIFGGSQGASSLNRSMVSALPGIKRSAAEKPAVIHITGSKDYEEVKNAYQAHGFTAVVYTFSFDMKVLYSASDLVICRAGAATINELMYAEKPAILIPYPHAAGDHQTKNAQHLVRKGCAVMVADRDLSGTSLGETIAGYMKNRNYLAEMIEKYKPLKEQAMRASSLLADAVLSITH